MGLREDYITRALFVIVVVLVLVYLRVSFTGEYLYYTLIIKELFYSKRSLLSDPLLSSLSGILKCIVFHYEPNEL